MRKNPLHITYNDLIEETESRLKWMQESYPSKIIAGGISSITAQRKMEVQKTLLRLLKKAKREPQLDLFQAFEKVR